MNIKIRYGGSIIALPADTVLAHLIGADEKDLKVLIYMMSSEEFRSDPEKYSAKAIKTLGMRYSEIEAAIAFWDSVGVIDVKTGENEELALDREANKKRGEREKKANTKLLVKQDAPTYTNELTADIIEEHGDLKQFIVEAQQIIGKMLSPNEVESIVVMYDYLRLDCEYLRLLFSYCAKSGKLSVKYIERVCYSLFERGIDQKDQLIEYIRAEEQKEGVLYKIKKLFGIGKRALITKEKNTFDRWLDTYGMSYEMIEKAYERTIERIHEPSLDYANAILKGWHESGYRTVDEVEEERENYKTAKKTKKSAKQKEELGFDVEEFMALAIERSYQEKN